jgi:hypothetical protein
MVVYDTTPGFHNEGNKTGLSLSERHRSHHNFSQKHVFGSDIVHPTQQNLFKMPEDTDLQKSENAEIQQTELQPMREKGFRTDFQHIFLPGKEQKRREGRGQGPKVPSAVQQKHALPHQQYGISLLTKNNRGTRKFREFHETIRRPYTTPLHIKPHNSGLTSPQHQSAAESTRPSLSTL